MSAATAHGGVNPLDSEKKRVIEITHREPPKRRPDKSVWLDRPMALLAAVYASGTFIAIYALFSLFGMRLGLGSLLAMLTIPEGGPIAFLLGVGWYYLIGFVATFAYAFVLSWFDKESNRESGAWFGVAFWVVGTLISPAIIDAHPLAESGELSASGALAWVQAILDFGAHLVFGIVAGTTYCNRPKTASPAPGR